jgi:N-acetylglucosaminyl-diphospho-decaprenol L-rhamnosyltransferase
MNEIRSSDRMSVAAIILNYFGTEKTLGCLLSLIDEELATIWLVDNSANKAELEKLQKALSDLPESLREKVRLLISKENLGFGKAINWAISQDKNTSLHHTHYLLLNNDAVVHSGLVRGLCDRMLAEPSCALAAPRLVYPEFELINGWYYRHLGYVTFKMTKSRIVLPFLTGCCLLVDSEIILDSGQLFDDDFFMYGEDIWLSWYVMSIGRSIASVPEVSLYHEGTGSSKKGTLFYEYHSARAHVLLAKKISRNASESALNLAGRVFIFSYERSCDPYGIIRYCL